MRRACSTGSTPTTTGWGTDPSGVAPSGQGRKEKGKPIHTRRESVHREVHATLHA